MWIIGDYYLGCRGSHAEIMPWIAVSRYVSLLGLDKMSNEGDASAGRDFLRWIYCIGTLLGGPIRTGMKTGGRQEK